MHQTLLPFFLLHNFHQYTHKGLTTYDKLGFKIAEASVILKALTAHCMYKKPGNLHVCHQKPKLIPSAKVKDKGLTRTHT